MSFLLAPHFLPTFYLLLPSTALQCEREIVHFLLVFLSPPPPRTRALYLVGSLRLPFALPLSPPPLSRRTQCDKRLIAVKRDARHEGGRLGAVLFIDAAEREATTLLRRGGVPPSTSSNIDRLRWLAQMRRGERGMIFRCSMHSRGYLRLLVSLRRPCRGRNQNRKEDSPLLPSCSINAGVREGAPHCARWQLMLGRVRRVERRWRGLHHGAEVGRY
mmetsp:Transcript_15403/g.38946  ORF Transcript_15403/g.38946 Transcript_15403/m.38946 type:complete len:217 (+) Transcript_15403:661-1311(+)